MRQHPSGGRHPASEGSIRIRLADDTVVSLEDSDVRRICDALWKLTTAPGAVAIVGMLEHERRRIVATRVEVRLTERETAVFHRAQTSL
jgi:hypothetical protein